MKGKFIVFEGPDGSGKSTIMEKVLEYLDKNNYEYIGTRDPGGTKISEDIRKIILSNDNKEMRKETEALLYAASRAQLVNELIIPNLEKGKLVLSDRYILSSLAYQAYGRGLGMDEVYEINRFASKGLKADLIFFFMVDAEIVLARKRKKFKSDRLENEDFSFHKRVYDGYMKAINMEDNVVIIDASQSIDKVYEDVLKKLLEYLGGVE